MPRKKKKRTGSGQHSKGKKRPRGWHHRDQTPTWMIRRDAKLREQRRAQTDSQNSDDVIPSPGSDDPDEGGDTPDGPRP